MEKVKAQIEVVKAKFMALQNRDKMAIVAAIVLILLVLG